MTHWPVMSYHSSSGSLSSLICWDVYHPVILQLLTSTSGYYWLLMWKLLIVILSTLLRYPRIYWIVYWVRYIIQENQRNTLIKDTMREQCVASLVESWYQIMVSVGGRGIQYIKFLYHLYCDMISQYTLTLLQYIKLRNKNRCIGTVL